MSVEREVIKEIMKFGSVKKMMGKELRYVEMIYDGVDSEYVWGNGTVLGLFLGGFEQYNDYVFGGKKEDGLYYFYKEDGESYSPIGYTDWETVKIKDIKEKWHSKLTGSTDVFSAEESHKDWVFIFPDGDIIDEREVWE